MASLLLRLKHWQVFLLLFVVPFLLQYGLKELFRVTGVGISDAVEVLLDALPAVFYLSWLWCVGLYLHRRLPSGIRVRSIYLHLAALYFLGYTFLLLYTLVIVRDNVLTGNLPLGMLLLLVPMHLFATFCFLYIIYFDARSVASVEEQRVVEFGEYGGLILQFLFLPVGIWFLQPRLRKLFYGDLM
ncbi:MAG: hypothetical protein LPK14_10190 [Hymenobacteraceae bacterium]|nr:hypothetical protein [Hymenobacteraceae bacterium]